MPLGRALRITEYYPNPSRNTGGGRALKVVSESFWNLCLILRGNCQPFSRPTSEGTRIHRKLRGLIGICVLHYTPLNIFVYNVLVCFRVFVYLHFVSVVLSFLCVVTMCLQ